MPKITAEISMSLDGFIAGPNDKVGQGLGEGGERLHEWLVEQASWREKHGLEGGKTGDDSEMFEDTWNSAGAIIVGKRMFDLAEGWGDEPPFHKPVFVLTHHAQEPQVKAGGTTYYFVTEGAGRALEEARAAAGEKDILVAGGANTIQQFIDADLLDELYLHVVPVLLGAGRPLFNQSGVRQVELQPAKVIESPNVTHIRYRFVK